MSIDRWSRLTAADIMKREMIAVPPRATAKEIVEKMQKFGISGVVVREPMGPILGVVSWRDIVDRLAGSSVDDEAALDYFRSTDSLWCAADDEDFDPGVVAEDVMNTDVLTIPLDANLRDIAGKMSEYRVHRLLVRDETSGVIVGILSTLDVMDALSA